ncbi:hypothetical protein [Streptomyces sp. NBC_01174]|uniref:hypothetical protein n=1 Tax=Streptomyces sp. NBC_01174 TaxID=2903758 RepID=UPI0038690156|nr:hypothetical protein OG414_21605 [Streptomyces sp. NBC_01174]
MGFTSENTAAHHLHAILSRIQGSNASSYAAGWGLALGAEWGSLEFSKKHSEIVNLLTETVQQLNALPERPRNRYLRYVPSWWTAVIQPVASWTDTNRPAVQIIKQDALDHLESAADIIAGTLAGSDAAPRSADLVAMKQQCGEWLDLLNEIDELELNGPVRDQLVAQIEHLIWLIDNVEMFGGARVAGEASRVVGSLAQAGATLTTSDPNTASRWQKAWFALIGICLVFNTGAPVVQESITSGGELFKEIAAVVQSFEADEPSAPPVE